MVSATSSDRFFRDIVGSMRNGVIAITRDGHIAVMNDVACHALHVPVRATNIGGHYADVLHGAPKSPSIPPRRLRGGALPKPRRAAPEVDRPLIVYRFR